MASWGLFKKISSVRLMFLVPLAIAIVAISILVFHLFKENQISNWRGKINRISNRFQLVLEDEIEEGGALLLSNITMISRDKDLMNAWRDRDRERLLELSKPYFELLADKYHVSHFSFHAPDRINFLRVHRPDTHGDIINRKTLVRAVNKEKSGYGIEAGRFGTFTLRSVCPWVFDGEVQGYIELGMNMEYLTEHIKNILQSDIVIALDKLKLNADLLEDMEQSGRRLRLWGEFSNYLVVASTLDTSSPVLLAHLRQSFLEKKIGPGLWDFPINNRFYACGLIEIKDISGESIGLVELFHDNTESISEINGRIRKLSTYVFTISALLFIFFFFLAGYIENKIKADEEELRQQVVREQKAEEALRQSEEKYRRVFGEMISGFALCELLFNAEGNGVDFRILETNPYFDSVLEIKGRDVINRRMSKFIPDPKGVWLKNLATVAISGKPLHLEQYFPQWQKHLEIRAYCPEKGKVALIFNDMTRRKKAEESLQRSLLELEQSNADLQQFAYIASHDLQEPLRKVSSFLGLLAQKYSDSLDKNAHEYIDFAVDGAERMKVLISDLLQFSRIGTRGGSFVDFPAAEALDQAMNNISIKLEERKAKVTSSPLPVIYADKMQVTLLFQNLISNAIKYNESQLPEVHVGVGVEDGQTVFSVKDNGIGIDPTYFDKIFLIFQRLHAKQKYSGTGIGLAICKRIIERHKGRIWVESEIDKGSTFFFTLGKV